MVNNPSHSSSAAVRSQTYRTDQAWSSPSFPRSSPMIPSLSHHHHHHHHPLLQPVSCVASPRCATHNSMHAFLHQSIPGMRRLHDGQVDATRLQACDTRPRRGETRAADSWTWSGTYRRRLSGVQFDMPNALRMPDGRQQQLSALKLPIGLALSGRPSTAAKFQDIFRASYSQWGYILSALYPLGRVAFKGRSRTELHHVEIQAGLSIWVPR